jgi:hypothetical protein
MISSSLGEHSRKVTPVREGKQERGERTGFATESQRRGRARADEVKTREVAAKKRRGAVPKWNAEINLQMCGK